MVGRELRQSQQCVERVLGVRVREIGGNAVGTSSRQ
jgi:hypothetical protein